MSFSFSGVKLKIDDRALDQLVNSPTGEVGQYMRRIAFEIRDEARTLVGVDTGRLKRSLYVKHGRRGRYQYVQVGSDVRHAWYHHEGTDPHTVRAPMGRVLRFNVGGRVVYATKTHIPAIRGRKYLTIPLRRAVRR